MKKLLSALCAFALSSLLAFAFVGCQFGGGNNNGGGNLDGEIDYSGTVTVWWPGSSVEMEAINQAKADYENLHPDVTIEVIGQSTPDFFNSYLLSMTGRAAPDIAYVDHVYVQTLAYYGYLADLSSGGYEELESKFTPSLWEPNFYEGKLYGLPMSANVLATVYNKTLIARAQNTTTDNITLPENYDELLQLCADICALNGADTPEQERVYGITLPSGTANNSMAAMNYLAFVDRSGGDGILSADLKTAQLGSEASVDAAQKLWELGEYSTATFAEARFETGMVGFIEMGPWKIEDYERYSEANGWEVGYTTAIPFTEGGNAGSTIGLYSLVVTNGNYTASGNSALAADFAAFVSSNDAYQLAFSTPQNLIPTTVSALEDEHYSGDVWQVFIDQLEDAVARPGSPVWSDIESELGTFVTNLVQHGYDSIDSVEMECVALNTRVQRALNDIYG